MHIMVKMVGCIFTNGYQISAGPPKLDERVFVLLISNTKYLFLLNYNIWYMYIQIP